MFKHFFAILRLRQNNYTYNHGTCSTYAIDNLPYILSTDKPNLIQKKTKYYHLNFNILICRKNIIIWRKKWREWSQYHNQRNKTQYAKIDTSPLQRASFHLKLKLKQVHFLLIMVMNSYPLDANLKQYRRIKVLGFRIKMYIQRPRSCYTYKNLEALKILSNWKWRVTIYLCINLLLLNSLYWWAKPTINN